MGKKKQQQQENIQLPDHDVSPNRHYFSPEENAGAVKEKKQKLSKREKKELRRQQAENEKRLIAEGVIAPRVRYAPRSFLWNLFAVCLAFFLGIFFVIGAFVFVGAKASIKTILNMVNLEYSNIVTEEYAEKSLIDLFHDVTTNEFTNLNSLGKYTPLLGNTLEGLNEQLGVLGVHLNIDELMGVNFDEIGGYFQENVIRTIRLGETLGLTPDDSPLMIAVCYGTEGEDFDVVDGAFQMREGKHATTIADLTEDATGIITRVTVEAALNTNADSPAAMRYLAYGSEGEHYDIENGEIVMRRDLATGELFRKKTLNDLTAEGTDVIGDAKLGDLMDLTDADSFMYAVKDWHVSDLQNANRINRLKISQIIDTEGNTSLMMNAIKDWRISDLMDQSKIDSLCIGDVLTIDESSPKILRSLQDTVLGSFGDAVDNIRLSDLLDDDLDDNPFLHSLQKSTLVTLASDIQALTVADIFGDKIYAYSRLDEIKSYRGTEGDTFEDYAQFIKYYEETGRNDAEFSKNRPELINVTEVTETRVLVSDPNVTVLSGWFEKNGSTYSKTEATDYDVYVEKTDSTILHYIESKPVVTPFYVWKQVDYDRSESEWSTVAVSERAGELYCTLGGVEYPISEDGFGYYITASDESGARSRIDLEKTISEYRLNGAPLPADVSVRYQKPGEGTDGYYYAVIRTYVEERYYNENDPTQNYATDGNETKLTFIGSGTGAKNNQTYTDVELDRYLDGVWYLLLANEDGTDGAQTKITDLSDKVTSATGFLDDIKLWELYVHNMLNTHAFRENFTQVGGEWVNLNELSIADILNYITAGSGS